MALLVSNMRLMVPGQQQDKQKIIEPGQMVAGGMYADSSTRQS